MILSVDPGKRNGYAVWTEAGTLTRNDVLDFDTLTDMCQNELDLTVIVYEGYRVDHRAARLKGSTNDASQTIGMLKSTAKLRGIVLHEQPNGILRVAGLHAGLKLPKSHIPDKMSAYLHGFYFFETLGKSAKEMRELSPYR